MSDSRTLATVAVVALVVGVGIGLTLPSLSAPNAAPDDAAEPSPPTGLVLGSSGAHCLANGSHDGWLYSVADGDHYNYAFNVTVRHKQGASVAASVTGGAAGDYTVAVETTGSERKQPVTDRDCAVGTTLTGAGTLPTNYSSVDIEVDGRVVTTVENEGTMPTLHRIDGAVRADGANASDRGAS
ncbi:hypothetical protein J2754_000551 [Halarchaeum solikamskense]|uniref:hypothetical protein n=1 Tax=Halarchaeum nitratireducens TaxID=489913 RepID=UPI001B3AA7D5|nr:hypothetical protein [Halarchaeum solikamskense]MBP2250254.1 hypothetical protein [Halarchaeum solikamskense]